MKLLEVDKEKIREWLVEKKYHDCPFYSDKQIASKYLYQKKCIDICSKAFKKIKYVPGTKNTNSCPCYEYKLRYVVTIANKLLKDKL